MIKIVQRVKIIMDEDYPELSGLYAKVVHIYPNWEINIDLYTCEFEKYVDTEGLWNCDMELNFKGRRYLPNQIKICNRLNKLKRVLK